MQPRKTAQDSAVDLLKVLQGEVDILHKLGDSQEKTDIPEKKVGINWLSNKQHAEEAFKMMERELAGYLSHPESQCKDIFNAIRRKHFSKGSITAKIQPGDDLLISLRNIAKGFPQFKKLEHVELNIYTILGRELAWKMFSFRQDILHKLCEFDNNEWKTNLDINTKALSNLKSLEKNLRPLKISEISLARWGFLSSFRAQPCASIKSSPLALGKNKF